MRAHLFAALTGALVACDRGAETSSFAGVTQSVVLSTSADGESTVSSGADAVAMETADNESMSSTTGSTGEGTKWDMAQPDYGAIEKGCQGKIDFLFVISTQYSMKWSQEQMLASFPGFIQAVEDQMTGFDIHILSANTDASWALDDCGACNGDGCDPQGTPPHCGADYTVCDKKLGAGVTFPTGEYASNRRCELDGGRRYITSEQQDLADAFACVGQVGIAGGGVSGQAMAAAVQPAITDPNDPDACNTGFIRRDALLV